MALSLQQINALSQPEFTRHIGPLFEHSPWIAERTWSLRPFASPAALHASLVESVRAASIEEQVGLIRAHPDLAGKLAIAGQLTDHSASEQKSARLDRLTSAQFERITGLNDRYRAKFGFPFVICVKDHSQETIFREFEKRVNHDCSTEIPAALGQIERIAWHRLRTLLGEA